MGQVRLRRTRSRRAARLLEGHIHLLQELHELRETLTTSMRNSYSMNQVKVNPREARQRLVQCSAEREPPYRGWWTAESATHANSAAICRFMITAARCHARGCGVMAWCSAASRLCSKAISMAAVVAGVGTAGSVRSHRFALCSAKQWSPLAFPTHAATEKAPHLNECGERGLA